MQIDLKKIIKPGLRIFISAVGNPARMSSTVVKVRDADIAVTIPTKGSYFYTIAKGTVADISFFAGSGSYTFSVAVLKRIILNGIPVLILEFPKEFERSERREALRVSTLFPIKLVLTELEGENEKVKVVNREYPALCVDISAGGIQIDAQSSKVVPLADGVVMEIDFCNALEDINRLKGVAVRAPRSPGDGWGIKFADIGKNAETKISRYIFRKQREKPK
ncbi:MAG: flagellar brake domain-containing protein [Deferribacteraceae bacterium]|jgi:c-di-GMP-binding flagellar brake protein YcgR|nr:flagellar brake domain-containing protein [Deferribacteraceae bacterium]